MGLMFFYVMMRMGGKYLVRPFYLTIELGFTGSHRPILDSYISKVGCKELRDELGPFLVNRYVSVE